MIDLLYCLVFLICYGFFYYSNKIINEMGSQTYAPDSTAAPDHQENSGDMVDDHIRQRGSSAKEEENKEVCSCACKIRNKKPAKVPKPPTKARKIYSIMSDVTDRSHKSPRIGDTVDAKLMNKQNEDTVSASVTPKGIVKSPVHKEALCYNMTHRNRGKCIIINQEVFDMGFDTRSNSVADARAIEETFKNLGFQTEEWKNFNHKAIISELDKLSAEDHTDSDCICIFILTHGLSHDFILAKDVAYRLDTVWKAFTGDKCPSLVGKPKLFFVQACRGAEADNGFLVQSCERSCTDSCGDDFQIPTHADFLIAYSTAEGFLSWKHPKLGSWFVQCACKIINQYWRTKDLLSMLTMTARMIATDYSSFDDFDAARHRQKQVPAITSMLIRNLYFTPKTDIERDE